jgi:hypothetical protein
MARLPRPTSPGAPAKANPQTNQTMLKRYIARDLYRLLENPKQAA